MNLVPVIIAGFFIVLVATCVAAAKILLGVSFPVACGIGIVSGWALGMLATWLSGLLPSKRK